MPQSIGGIMAKQLKLNLFKGTRGGRRPGAGRKRIHSKGVAHRVREKVHMRHAMHVNFKYRTTIRHKKGLSLLKRAILNARKKGPRVIHFSLQSNHIHMILEAQDNAILTRGMRSLTVTIAKGLGKGRVQLERYHLHVLKTLAATRNAVHYVLFNEQKHSGLKKAYVDGFSSLGVVKDLKNLAKEKKLTVILRRISEVSFLDSPRGWMIRQV
jgi:REP element-mobilizing transposase RayT